MNNSTTALKGLYTFAITLLVSLGVFGAVYYVTSYPAYHMDIESSTKPVETPSVSDDTPADSKVSDASPFGRLTADAEDVPRRVVLAGATVADDTTVPTPTPSSSPVATPSTTTTPETSPAAVPNTGALSITVSFVASVLALSLGALYWARNPRVLALRTFEDELLR